MILKLLKFSIIIFLILVIIPVQKTKAAGNFTTDYHVTYSVSENNTTHATLNITLTNTSSTYYASSYKILVGFNNINNIHAQDTDGSIVPVIEKTSDGHVINLQFNKKAVGLGAKLSFTISFDTPDVATQYGRIWEINIPGIGNPEDFDQFSVEVKVPSSFGEPTYTKPAQNGNKLIFTKEQLNNAGISISFGDRQAYSFHLIYHIKNDNLYPIRTEIALPPTTNYQTVFIQNISPKPENVVLDKDNNWLARFNLKPSQKIDVSVDGKAEILLNPRPEELSTQDRLKYLEEKPYWQTNDPEIKQLAKDLKTPEAIYNYVVKTLKYDFTRVTDDKPRLGAKVALQNPSSAVCLEYTDLFIALARAAGIPAREINGYAYTQNSKQRPLSLVKDILHAWPEYYDSQQKTWIMIDPTWGSTTGGVDYFSTLDFDHFAFVRKGLDSSYPVPAGGYKFLTYKNTKDVAIDFAQNLPQEEDAFDIISLFPKSAMTAFPIKGKISVKNNSQNLILGQVLNITSEDLIPNEQIIQTISMPPFGSVDTEVSFRAEPFLTNKIKSFTIRANSQEITQKIAISPLLIKEWWTIGGGIAIGVFCIIIFVIAIKSRRL